MIHSNQNNGINAKLYSEKANHFPSSLYLRQHFTGWQVSYCSPLISQEQANADVHRRGPETHVWGPLAGFPRYRLTLICIEGVLRHICVGHNTQEGAQEAEAVLARKGSGTVCTVKGSTLLDPVRISLWVWNVTTHKQGITLGSEVHPGGGQLP